MDLEELLVLLLREKDGLERKYGIGHFPKVISKFYRHESQKLKCGFVS